MSTVFFLNRTSYLQKVTVPFPTLCVKKFQSLNSCLFKVLEGSGSSRFRRTKKPLINKEVLENGEQVREKERSELGGTGPVRDPIVCKK